MNDPEPRYLLLAVVPGQDVDVDYSGFALWEVWAILNRAVEKIEDAMRIVLPQVELRCLDCGAVWAVEP